MHPMKLPGPKARALVKRDSAVISPSYPRDYPFVMDHGKGSEVWDVDGNRFLDFMAGIAVASTGHAHPKVVKAIQQQVEKFIHISSDFYHEGWIKLAEKFAEIAPFDDYGVSFMTNSGTEAVETAIKLARYHTGRSNFIGFTGGFHGRTMGAVTFTASKPKYHKGFYPLMNGVLHAPFPDLYRPVLERRKGEDYGETVVRYIQEQILDHILPPEEVAGILVEPIQGEGGYVVPPPGFFPALRELCDKYDILLIADEVQSGMGRTGKWWAIEHFDTEPDIVTSAKGIASGMPLGACIARRDIMDWERGAHGNTYGGNPISCAASLATIELIEKEYMKNAAEVGQYTLDALAEIQARHPSIGDVRGLGLMIGVEFVLNRETREPAEKIQSRVVNLAFERGLLLLGCSKSVIRIAPPLSISQSEVNEGLKIFEEAVTLAEKEFGLRKTKAK
ncbi:MAG: acetylornithine aminotransferase [Anaerolineaceae bacterium]|nr:acetyl ornithine aminotransferase family protein [Anaerolineae bacterium]MBL1173159.1 acetyl ornithine aminotransferase family protein [Chloroflexota bacterium]MBV6465479.1 5-aminovalerate aminotransferase DavT [Anaerolineales bacterium]MCE7904427.1 acetyl ornithine aminotransferase family protein [Anaerolineae bacterium CFX3]MDL1926057.1 acetyl ornithine aminotransferase family protein [Anaerolineae bacterium AMX1]GER79301.1 acetyl ornithine aminotransferase family protein [Candidatus Deni